MLSEPRTSPDIKAAAERLMELSRLPIGQQKAYVRDWPELGWDGIAVARAWLAEHPVDSDEPTDEAFILSLGCREATNDEHQPDMRTRQWYRKFFLHLPRHLTIVFYAWRYSPGSSAVVSAVSMSTSTYHQGEMPWPNDLTKTKGQVRRIIEAMGGLPLNIDLTEAGK